MKAFPGNSAGHRRSALCALLIFILLPQILSLNVTVWDGQSFVDALRGNPLPVGEEHLYIKLNHTSFIYDTSNVTLRHMAQPVFTTGVLGLIGPSTARHALINLSHRRSVTVRASSGARLGGSGTLTVGDQLWSMGMRMVHSVAKTEPLHLPLSCRHAAHAC